MIKFRCSGQLGRTIVLYTWKSLQCVRQYVVGRDPRTPAQLVQRSRMTTAVAWWQYNQNPDANRPAWAHLRTSYKKHMTGFSLFCSNFMRQILTTPTAHFATHAANTAPNTVTVYLQPADFSAPALEPGYFIVYYSTLPWTDSNPVSAVEIIPAILTVTLPATVAFPLYILLRKGYYRSGIMHVPAP